jgi:alkylhydroperoxidase family enzyme
MTLIPQVNLDDLSPESRAAYTALPHALGIHKILAHSKGSFLAGRQYSAALMGAVDLPLNVREIIVLVTAELDKGVYEWDQHLPLALKCGVTEEQVKAIQARDFSSAAFDERVRALVVFAADVVENVAASEANVKRALEHYTPSVLVDTILICGLYMTMSRITRTARVPTDPPVGALKNFAALDKKDGWTLVKKEA